MADGFRDTLYLDWLLANKFDEKDTTADFTDLMNQIHQKGGKGLDGMNLIAARMHFNNRQTQDYMIEAQIKKGDK